MKTLSFSTHCRYILRTNPHEHRRVWHILLVNQQQRRLISDKRKKNTAELSMIRAHLEYLKPIPILLGRTTLISICWTICTKSSTSDTDTLIQSSSMGIAIIIIYPKPDFLLLLFGNIYGNTIYAAFNRTPQIIGTNTWMWHFIIVFIHSWQSNHFLSVKRCEQIIIYITKMLMNHWSNHFQTDLLKEEEEC